MSINWIDRSWNCSKGYLEAGKNEYIPPVVTLRPFRAKDLLGVDIPVEDMIVSLNRLEIESTFDGEKLSCKIPYFRTDLEQEADIIEEIGRMYGLETLNHIHYREMSE